MSVFLKNSGLGICLYNEIENKITTIPDIVTLKPMILLLSSN